MLIFLLLIEDSHDKHGLLDLLASHVLENTDLPLQATRYAKGGAESGEYCDEKLNDVLPNFFLDSHNS